MLPQVFDLTPYGIIKTLGLKNPIYLDTAKYGHFGMKNNPWYKYEGKYTWENLDMVDKIKEYFE